MELFSQLSDRTAEQISGGKDKWDEINGQPIPPGLYKNFTQNGKLPQGLACNCDGSQRGEKNGFGESNLPGVVVPPGLAK